MIFSLINKNMNIVINRGMNFDIKNQENNVLLLERYSDFFHLWDEGRNQYTFSLNLLGKYKIELTTEEKKNIELLRCPECAQEVNDLNFISFYILSSRMPMYFFHAPVLSQSSNVILLKIYSEIIKVYKIHEVIEEEISDEDWFTKQIFYLKNKIKISEKSLKADYDKNNIYDQLDVAKTNELVVTLEIDYRPFFLNDKEKLRNFFRFPNLMQSKSIQGDINRILGFLNGYIFDSDLNNLILLKQHLMGLYIQDFPSQNNRENPRQVANNQFPGQDQNQFPRQDHNQFPGQDQNQFPEQNSRQVDSFEQNSFEQNSFEQDFFEQNFFEQDHSQFSEQNSRQVEYKYDKISGEDLGGFFAQNNSQAQGYKEIVDLNLDRITNPLLINNGNLETSIFKKNQNFQLEDEEKLSKNEKNQQVQNQPHFNPYPYNPQKPQYDPQNQQYDPQNQQYNPELDDKNHQYKSQIQGQKNRHDTYPNPYYNPSNAQIHGQYNNLNQYQYVHGQSPSNSQNLPDNSNPNHKPSYIDLNDSTYDNGFQNQGQSISKNRDLNQYDLAHDPNNPPQYFYDNQYTDQYADQYADQYDSQNKGNLQVQDNKNRNLSQAPNNIKNNFISSGYDIDEIENSPFLMGILVFLLAVGIGSYIFKDSIMKLLNIKKKNLKKYL
jgi:hypothetical protein